MVLKLPFHFDQQTGRERNHGELAQEPEQGRPHSRGARQNQRPVHNPLHGHLLPHNRAGHSPRLAGHQVQCRQGAALTPHACGGAEDAPKEADHPVESAAGERAADAQDRQRQLSGLLRRLRPRHQRPGPAAQLARLHAVALAAHAAPQAQVPDGQELQL